MPNAILWDCQKPSIEDQGQWVVVSAGMILDGHNCSWLMLYPHESLAGGSMYAIQLPNVIPPSGDPAGPPLPDAFRNFGGAPIDMRSMLIGATRHPENLPKLWQEMQAKFQAAQKSAASQSPASKPN